MKREHINCFYWYVKRFFDIIFSFILIIVTFPLMVLTGICLYINLGKPLFNQRRYREGLNKKKFLMLKLRTKLLDVDHLPREQRYTKFSSFIDKTHFNELPQLFNVLIGDMSFIGPRPFIPGEDLPEGKISEKRYLVRPGLSGLAYIHGGIYISYEDKLRYDEEYYDNFGFMQDLKILLLTPREMIRQGGKYYEKKAKKSKKLKK